jgi:hypothetical protein
MTMFQNLHRMMANGGRLNIACEGERCGHTASLDRAAAFGLLGPDATPFEVRRKLRCSACRRWSPRVWIARG